MNLSLVLTAVPDKKIAEKIAVTLIEEKLAACVQISSSVRSVYHWQGKVESTEELQLWIKTSSLRTSDLTKRLKELHPYQVPEILSFSSDSGLDAYVKWVESETSSEKS